MKSGTFTPATALMAGSAVLAALLAGLWFAPGAPERWRQWSAPEPQPPALDEVRQARLAFNPAAGAATPQIRRVVAPWCCSPRCVVRSPMHRVHRVRVARHLP